MEINREELAWAAGLFEGEGCFTFSRKSRKWRQVMARVAMTDKDVLESFQRATGLGSIYGPKCINGRKPCWTWAVSSFEETQALVALLWPWLKTRRKTKAKEVLITFRANTPEWTRGIIDRNQTIRDLYANRNNTQQQLASQFGCSQANISRIVLRRGM